jgi:hypothetical protein
MKRGTPTHPKVYALAARMRVPHAMAVGYLELLWHFTARYAPQGDIGKFDDATIANACSYQGEPSRLVSAMCAVGWLEVSPRCRLAIHDWHEHADETVRKSLQRKGLQFLTLPDDLSRQVPDSVRTLSRQVPDSVATKSACLSQSLSHSLSKSHSEFSPAAETPLKPKRKFVKPSPAEVTDYGRSIGYEIDGAAFTDFYEAKGWVVGKSPMKDWKAAVRTWTSRGGESVRRIPATKRIGPQAVCGVCHGSGQYIPEELFRKAMASDMSAAEIDEWVEQHKMACYKCAS